MALPAVRLSVMAILPETAKIPVSTRSAYGSSCLRTRELAPSAPIKTSPVAVDPSSKRAVTTPEGASSKATNVLPKRTISSSPSSRMPRNEMRLTGKSFCSSDPSSMLRRRFNR